MDDSTTSKSPAKIDNAAQPTAKLRNVGGSHHDEFNTTIVNQVLRATWVVDADEPGAQGRMIDTAAAALMGIAPKDELEGMMAAQLVAAHNAAMECYRRAMLPEQTTQARGENINHANKLSRTYATLLETLNRHRGKGQQKMTVEHVHVHAGGQAVVGVVEGRRGEEGIESKIEGQPHAMQSITHAPEPPMRSAHEARDAVPVPRNGERPMPDARGNGAGRP